MKLFVIIKISNYRKRKARKNWYSKSERACPRSSNQRGISWSSTLHRDLVDRPWRFTELLHKRPKPSFGVDHMARTFVNVRFDDSLTFDSNELVTDARITQHVIPSYSHCALKKKKRTKQRALDGAFDVGRFRIVARICASMFTRDGRVVIADAPIWIRSKVVYE